MQLTNAVGHRRVHKALFVDVKLIVLDGILLATRLAEFKKLLAHASCCAAEILAD